MLTKSIMLIIFIVRVSTENNLAEYRDCMLIGGIPKDRIVDRESNSSHYTYLNHQWNLRLQQIYPLGYFLPTSTKDVQLAVLCGKKTSIPVVPKSGGHSFEAISFGTRDTLIIDLREMDKIKVYEKDGIASVGPGALLGAIYDKIWKSGGFGLPMGDCLTVGIGGFTLGGGTGHFSSVYGLAMDNLIELEMVDANGVSHVASPKQNQDLFWALRGIGSGYIGIVTNFKFKLFQTSHLNITFMNVSFNMKDSLQALEAWQNWAKVDDPTTTAGLYIGGAVSKTVPAGGGIDIRLTHTEDSLEQPWHFHEVVKRIFPAIANITSSTFLYKDFLREVSYAQIAPTRSQSAVPADLDWSTLRNYKTVERYHKRKSFYVKQMFNSSKLEKIAKIIQSVPRGNIWIYFSTEGGAIRNIKPTETSYVHRDALYLLLVQYEGSNRTEDVNEGMAWIHEFISESKFMDSGENYQNYVDGDVKDYLKSYYGQNLPRLLFIKRAWDPNNYFQDPQSIPVTVL